MLYHTAQCTHHIASPQSGAAVKFQAVLRKNRSVQENWRRPWRAAFMEVLGALGALNLGASGEIKGAASSDIDRINGRYKTQIVIPIDYEWSVGIMHFPIRASIIEAGTTFLCGKNTEIIVANFSGASTSFTVYYGFNDSGLVKWVTDANGYHRDKYHVIFIKVC